MIKYLVMDVDGTLTDGKIYMGPKGEAIKAFSIKDGCGIRMLLPRAGITPVIITGRKSAIVENRCKELGIDYLFQGVSDKVGKLREFLREHSGLFSEVAYAGDDLNDLDCIIEVKSHGGIVGVPSDAAPEVKIHASFISESTGGEGAVRSFIEYLLSI